METIDANDLVNATFEACAEFATAPDGSPVCRGCGWLDSEHTPEVAPVHALPNRTHRVAVPKRLAS